MSTPADGPGRRRARWWSPLLVAHVALVVVLLVASRQLVPSTDASLEPGLAEGAVSALRMLLAAPWWLVLWAAPSWVPLVLNLVVHAALLQVASRRPGAEVRSGWPRSRSVQFALAVLAGAAVWGAWLGWDHTTSYDVVTRQVESPYVTLQVLGCAVTVGVATALLAARWSPLAAAAGVGVGFWLCWTVEAASSDPTGLWGVGALALAAGLGAGTSFSAFVGRVLLTAGGRTRQSA